MEKAQCCVCEGNRRFRIWSHRNDRFLLALGVKARVNFYVCRDCSVGFADPRLSDSELDDLYTNLYRTDDISEEYIRVKERESRERIDCLKHFGIRVPGRVLEIGSSEGTLLRVLRDDEGWEIEGCEPFTPYAQYGISKWNIKTKLSFFRSDDFSDKYDLVVFIHVLEHIPDPRHFLAEIARVINKDGYIFFETPNLLAPYKNRIKHAMLPAPHLAIYSRFSIHQLLSKCGFEIVEIQEGLNMRVLAKLQGYKFSLPSMPIQHALRIAWLYRRRKWTEGVFLLGQKLEGYLSNQGRRLIALEHYNKIRAAYRKVLLRSRDR